MSKENQSINNNSDKIVSDNNLSNGVDVQSKSPIKPIDNSIQNNKLDSEFVNKNNTSESFNNNSVKNNIILSSDNSKQIKNENIIDKEKKSNK